MFHCINNDWLKVISEIILYTDYLRTNYVLLLSCFILVYLVIWEKIGPKKKRPAENTGSLPPTPRKQRKSSKQNSCVASMNFDYDLLADAILRKQNSQTGGDNVQHGTNVIDSLSMANHVLTDVSCTAASTAISMPLSSVHLSQPVDSSTAGAQPELTFTFRIPHGFFNYSPHSVPSTSESHPSGGTSSQFAWGSNHSSLVGCGANNSAFTKDLHLTSVTQQLLCAAISPSTRKAYLRSWNLLLLLFIQVNIQLPLFIKTDMQFCKSLVLVKP